MEGIIFAIQYVENSKRYHFHQTNMQNQSSIYQFFHYNSLKTVFYKIPTANYMFFDWCDNKNEAPYSIASTPLLKFFTFKLINFSKQPNIEKNSSK